MKAVQWVGNFAHVQGKSEVTIQSGNAAPGQAACEDWPGRRVSSSSFCAPRGDVYSANVQEEKRSYQVQNVSEGETNTWTKNEKQHRYFLFFPFSCHTGRLLRSHFLNQGLNPGHDSESTEPSPLGRQGTPCFLIFSFLPLLGAQLVKNLPAMWETWV